MTNWVECEVCGVVGIGEVCPQCKAMGEDWFDVAMRDYPSLPEFWDDSYPASLVAYDNENLF